MNEVKTKRDLFKELYNKHSIQATEIFHWDLSEQLTDEAYQKQASLWEDVEKYFENNIIWKKEEKIS